MKNRYYKFIVVIAAVFCAFFAAQISDDKVYAKDKDGDYVIVIDPGHGAADAGSVSKHTNDKESELNWNIAVALKAELQTYSGVKVYLTRGSAEFQSNVGRASTGRELGADYLISIHNNSSTSTSPNGLVSYGTVEASLREASKNMSLAIAAEAKKLGLNLYNGGYAVRHSSYSKTSDYYTFLGESSRSGIPSLIVEHCYLSNPSDAAFMHKIENQHKMGAADATGIAKTLGLLKRGVNAGGSITLTRTYSAYIKGVDGGSYRSSDESVAVVRSDGLITAVNSGSAQIICTAKDGTTKKVQVTVPEVKMVGIAAGVVQKAFTSKEEAYAYNQDSTMVKALYSDGSAVQVSGYSQGDLYLGTPYDEGGGHLMTPVCRKISYKGMSATLKFYYYSTKGQVTSSASTGKPVGTNKDIFMVPGIYSGITDDGKVVVEVPETEPTETEAEQTTDAAEETESIIEENSQTKQEEDISQTKKDKSEFVWIIIISAILVIIIIAAVIILYIQRRNTGNVRRRRRRRRRHRRRRNRRL